MSKSLKNTAKWGAVVLGILFVGGIVFAGFFPEMNAEMAQAESKWNIIFVILSLVVTLLKQIITFIGFLTTILKLGAVLLFVAVFLGIGLMILRTWKSGKSNKE